MKYVILLFLLCFPTVTAVAEDIDIGWNANSESDLETYRLYKRSDSNFTKGQDFIDVGKVTQTTTSVSEEGPTFFALTAVDESGNESNFSNTLEVADTFPPNAPGNLRRLP